MNSHYYLSLVQTQLRSKVICALVTPDLDFPNMELKDLIYKHIHYRQIIQKEVKQKLSVMSR